MTDVLALARRVEQSTSPFGCCTWEEARHLACAVLDLRAKVATVELERDAALQRQRTAEEEIGEWRCNTARAERERDEARAGAHP